MVTKTASTTIATTAALISGSGSLNGIAAQVSLPNISTARLQCRWALGCAGSRGVGSRRGLVEDALEQRPVDRGAAQVGVDERPLPIERDDIPPQRRRFRRNRRARVQLVRTDPATTAQ